MTLFAEGYPSKESPLFRRFPKSPVREHIQKKRSEYGPLFWKGAEAVGTLNILAGSKASEIPLRDHWRDLRPALVYRPQALRLSFPSHTS